MGDVETYNSSSDPDPYNPDTSSGQSSQTTLPSDLSVPDLSMAWNSIPEFNLVATPPGGSGRPSSITDVSGDVTVDLGGLRNTAETMLEDSMLIVWHYEDLKALFLSEKDWVYGQQATEASMETGGMYQGAHAGTMADPIQADAIAFANGSGGNPGMNAVQEFALQSIGNAMGVLGELIAAMNSAGTAYAQADVWSKFPAAS